MGPLAGREFSDLIILALEKWMSALLQKADIPKARQACPLSAKSRHSWLWQSKHANERECVQEADPRITARVVSYESPGD